MRSVYRGFLILAVCVMATAGCKGKIVATIYTSDIRYAAEGEAMSATLDVALEVSTESTCKEHSPAITEALQLQYSEVEFVGCEDVGFNTFANFRVQAPIVFIEGHQDSLSEDYGHVTAPVYILGWGNEKAITVGFVVGSSRFEEMKEYLPDSLTMYGDIDAEFHVSISNDERNPVKVLTGNVFVNGSPTVYEEWFEIKRRGVIDIALSNVANAFLQGSGKPAVLVAHIEYPD